MLLNLIVFPASVYLLIVSMCVANRMTRRTKLTRRVFFAAVAFVASWSLSRVVMLEWIFTPANVALASVVVACSVIMAWFPRVRV